MRSLNFEVLLKKDDSLKDELSDLSLREPSLDLELSIIGTIDYYEAFLMGYISRITSNRPVSTEDYDTIKNYTPFLSEKFLKSYGLLRKSYLQVEQHLQRLDKLRRDILTTRPESD